MLTTYLFERRFWYLNIALAFLLVFVAFIPISKPVSTIAEVASLVFVLFPLVDKSFRRIFIKRLKEQRYIFLVSVFYAFYILGIFYSTNKDVAVGELMRKHYFLTLPLLLAILLPEQGRSKLIKDTWTLSNSFVSLLIIAMSLAGIFLFKAEPGDLSPFVQRPRASLFLAFSVLISIEALFSIKTENQERFPLFYGLGLLLNLLALFLLGGRVGMLAFVLCLPLFLLSRKIRRTPLLVIMSILLLLFLLKGSEYVIKPFKEALNEIEEKQLGYINGSIEESSMGKRMLYLESHLELFEENPVFGAGSGDVFVDVEPYFKASGFELPANRPHNQFLDIGVRFGVVGLFFFLLLLLSIFYRSQRSALAFSFMLMLSLSMLFDDTLETQAGISFTTLFLAFFILKLPQIEKDLKKKLG